MAKEVSLVATGCRCGLAMWDAHGHTDDLEMAIRQKDWPRTGPPPQVIEGILTQVEQECNVKMEKAVKAFQELRAAADKRDWATTERRFVELRTFVRGPVEESAERKED